MIDIIEQYPQGHWCVGDRKFVNKFQALLYSNQTHLPVHYRYFDSVWGSFDRSLLGKYTLKELYKQRAQQLRDKYDYIILYFSGGADSYNVLRSFIDNGIKIDEVCVKWCNATIESHTKIYIPNEKEQSAYNYLSEWDYAIKPVLDWLTQYHPKVKIEIVDWFKDKKLIGSEDIFSKVNHWHDIEVTSLAVWSPSENHCVEKGLKVASVYGIDKPSIYFEGDVGYMWFGDNTTTMGMPNENNIFGTEYFYWAPDFPILTFEMAHQAIKAFRTNVELVSSKFSDKIKHDPTLMMRAHQIQQKKLRHVLYDNWTDRFQALKPEMPDRSDKHWWIFQHPELAEFKDSFNDMLKLHLNQIVGSTYVGEKDKKQLYRALNSKKHFVC
jgi:hypothetical protein